MNDAETWQAVQRLSAGIEDGMRRRRGEPPRPSWWAGHKARERQDIERARARRFGRKRSSDPGESIFMRLNGVKPTPRPGEEPIRYPDLGLV